MDERNAPRFARPEPRARVRAYVAGLAAESERKNGWTLAEQASEVSPDGMPQRRTEWDVEGSAMTCATTSWSTGAHPKVLIVEETGFLKKVRSATESPARA